MRFRISSILSFVIVFLSCESAKQDQITLSSELLVLSETQNPIQKFKFNPDRDTLITGRHGTKIFIPAKSLIFDDGRKATSTVTVELKEVYDKSDMILNRLSTTSDGQLLATSGMIQIEAYSKKEKLQLNDGSFIKIQFKRITSTPFMRTYLAETDSTGVNWNLDKDNIYDTIVYEEISNYILTLPFGSDSIAAEVITYGLLLMIRLSLVEEIFL